MKNDALKKLYKEKLQPHLDRYDEMEHRQRVMVGAMVLVVVGALWMSLFYDPLKAEQARNVTETNDLNTMIEDLDIQIQKIKEQGEYDPNEEMRAKRERLKARLEKIDEQLDEFTVDHISPTQMVFVLEEMLNKETSLVLDAMQSEPAEPIVKSLKDLIDSERTSRNMYRHGIVMQFSGDYMSTMQYLKLMEELRWDFFWDDLTYEVGEHPNAKVTIRLHTLSGEESWINIS